MKNYPFYLLGTIFNTIATAQIVNIPDVNFKAKLLAANPTTLTIAGYGNIPNVFFTKVDTNDDGEIQISEAQAINYLSVSGSNISDLTGIEKFINLTSLGCSVNNLTNLNISQLIHLNGLGCFNNQLTTLDISNQPNLTILSCQNNQISSLDFTNNTLLENVFCNNNHLSSIDFSYNLLFKQLDCFNNPNLTSVNIKNGATQLLGTQTYYNQCWTGLPSLTTICADDNEISALQTYLTGCGIDINPITITSDCSLSVDEYDSNDITISPNPSTGLFLVSFKDSIKEVTIKVFTFLGQELFYETFYNTNQTNLNINHLANGTYVIKISNGNEIVNKLIIKK